ncbi:MAG: ROK family transcriptional regulator [Salinibacterium sp.]|nr:ROK family transcriptional regulator [Salinibacterium sp.]
MVLFSAKAASAGWNCSQGCGAKVSISDEAVDGTVPDRFRKTLGSNLDSLRVHNLSTILTRIHHDGPLYRSDLAAASGLNRSTITILVNELIDRGLVVEANGSDEGSKKSVGRPSMSLHPSGRILAIAVNPEIDAITVGVVSLGGQLQRTIRYETDEAPTMRRAVKITKAIIEGIQAMLPADARIVGIGVAVPGLTDDIDGSVALAPHLGWRQEPLARVLAEETGLPVWAANDAHLGVLAETVFGGGAHVGSTLYLNGGASGIGGGVVSGGIMLKGAMGFAGELGHFRIRSGGKRDSAGLQGTLESEVSRDDLLRSLGLEGRDVLRLDEVLAAPRSPEAQDEIDRQVRALGTALGSMVTIFNPDLIVLGGFLGSLLDAEPERLRRVVAQESLAPQYAAVKIRRPELRDNILLVGAAELAFGALLRDPTGYDVVAESSLLPVASVEM